MTLVTTRIPLIQAVMFYCLLIYAGLLLISVSYGPIYPGLDPSWAYALNRFAHGPEIFGKDIVITYGPLGYLAVPEHLGNNLQIAIAAHVVVWCLLLYLLVVLWESGEKWGALLFTLGLIFSNKLYADYWDYLINGIAIIAFFLLIKRPDSPSVLAILSVTIGVIFLVKFTGYILCMVLLLLHAATRVFGRATISWRERGLLLSAALSGPFAYLIYHPSLVDFAGYLRGSINMASGYSTSMSLPVETDLAWRAAVVCGVILACLVVCVAAKWVSVAGAAMVSAISWVAFKHGYVRNEPTHASIFFCFAILAMAFLLAQVPLSLKRTAAFALVFAAFSAFALESSSRHWHVWSRDWWSPGRTLTQMGKLTNWAQATSEVDSMSDEAFRSTVINSFTQELGQSRVLFFPMGVSYGSRGHVTNVPYYATQAYSAYTAFLDKKSAENIAKASPPIDYVFVEWLAIDGRNPLLDVPATWNALFSGFVPESSLTDAFVVKRRPSPIPVAFAESGRKDCTKDTWVDVPPAKAPLALSLSLRPTLVGRAVTTLYQLGIVNLEVQARSGFTSTIRIPPEVVSSPFPINYLPLTSAALNALWKDNVVTDPIVRFRLTGPGLSLLRCEPLRFYHVTGTSVRVM